MSGHNVDGLRIIKWRDGVRHLIDPEVLEEKATAWVNEVVPNMYKALERAGITYSEDLLCESLSDGFKAGYCSRLQEEDVPK